jgi:nitrogen fixation/metabolism regulation signal transduction histidine kinase
MTFGTKIVGILLLLALVPVVMSIFLLEDALSTGENWAHEHEQDLANAVDRASEAYRELFDARKEEFRANTRAIAATWNGHIDDPQARYIRKWRVIPNGPSGDSGDAFPEDKWRAFDTVAKLNDGRTLEIEYVANRDRFREYDAIGIMQQLQATHEQLHITGNEHKHKIYHWVYVGLFALLLLPVTAVGLVMAHRLSRRLGQLSSAARDVGAGRLDVRVRPKGGDEVAQLGRAFDEMVAELAENRARIAYLEKIGAWQEVARRLAHEIKNPLTPIQLAVQQLGSKYAGGDVKFKKMLDESIEIVGEEIGTLRRLVEDFSAFAKLPRVATAPLDLGELVADVVRGHPEWEGKVRPGALDEPLRLAADKQLLRRALVNLVENALQAGAKTVEVRAERTPEVAHLIVDDDGPGVGGELRDRIFEPYFTTKEHGTGLGLAIVKKIALEHGGDISCEASPSGGARFVMKLPLGQETPPSS